MDHPLKYIRATQRWKAKNQQAEAQIRKDDQPLETEDQSENEPVETPPKTPKIE